MIIEYRIFMIVIGEYSIGVLVVGSGSLYKVVFFYLVGDSIYVMINIRIDI